MEQRARDFQSEWLESFHLDNTYDLGYAEYQECVKHAAQFLTAFGAFNDSQTSSTPEQSTEEQEILSWPNVVITDISREEMNDVPYESVTSIQ